MNRILRITLIIAVGILPFTAGCKKEKAPEKTTAEETEAAEPKYDNSLKGEEGIKNAIRGYNQAVIHGNMKTDYLKFVRKYASDHEASRVVAFVTEDRTKGRVMRSRLAELAFENISTGAEMTAVYTRERWEFDYLDLNTGKVREPLSEMHYKLKYIMVQDNDKWIVGRLEQVEQPQVTVYSTPRSFEQ